MVYGISIPLLIFYQIFFQHAIFSANHCFNKCHKPLLHGYSFQKLIILVILSKKSYEIRLTSGIFTKLAKSTEYTFEEIYVHNSLTCMCTISRNSKHILLKKNLKTIKQKSSQKSLLTLLWNIYFGLVLCSRFDWRGSYCVVQCDKW